MDHFTDGALIAAHEISILMQDIDKAIAKVNSNEAIHGRTRLVAARQLIPLHERLKTERNKLLAMTRHAAPPIIAQPMAVAA